jgi:2-octaprenyl-6-methoxyphenol hydroxylase
MLRALELWQGLADCAAAIRHIHISSAGHFGATRLHATDLRLDALGHVVEYHHLYEQLLRHAQQETGVRLITSARVEAIKQLENTVDLSCQIDGRQSNIHSTLLVVADGATSSIRDQLSIPVQTTDYDQTAVVANVKINGPNNDTAFERFAAQGPLAMLPLPEARYALVWTRKPDEAGKLMQLDDSEFLRQLQQQFGYRLGRLVAVGRRASFDLKLSRAGRLVSGQSVLIGNAANTLHPVAGQGFNLAMRDIGALFDCLQDVDLTHSDELIHALADYQQIRGSDQRQTVNLSGGLVQLFSNDLPLLNHMRSGALALLDLCPWLKDEVSWQGMGYGPGLNSLMRGAL